MYHDLIFESAEHVFAEKGFDDASMQDVAHEAGISLKTLYATFPGKQELYDEIQLLRAGAVVAQVGAAIEAAGSDTFACLEHAVRAYVSFLLEHPDWLRLHLRHRLAWGIGPADGEPALRWAQGVAQYADLIGRGIAEGVFYPGDADAMAMMTLSIMQVQLLRAKRRSPSESEALGDEIVLQLRRLLCPPQRSSSPKSQKSQKVGRACGAGLAGRG